MFSAVLFNGPCVDQPHTPGASSTIRSASGGLSEPNAAADPNSPLYGENVTLTGEFEPHDKGELWQKIVEQGAQVGKNVTKKTTVLVVGEWATVTSKEKRARELQDKGQDIQIWQASQLLEALGLDEKPPF